ncbi:hypothetical protein SAMN05444274_10692 [Mariniphaga anaerophila]|uniref:Uncharacterized protein n=1 Tax=Mariniphaga anaerophila TaxID=1484053 RepID=A0A1M5CF71_9BACT|nr:hypothetical protein [Mariniphaga anaerophila]SHF53257.1 hypothetical protein SAMN05444274_10692 [Mariniphaga anaerophila]
MTGIHKPIDFSPTTKKLLAQVLGISKSQLNREMSHLSDEIITKFPKYRKEKSILALDMFYWLCGEIGGINQEIAVYRICEIIPNYKDQDIERIEKAYGLNKKNQF